MKTLGEHVEEQLTWYANGTLGEAETKMVENHLSACAQCRAELEWLREVRDQTRSSVPDFAPEPGLQRLMEKIRAERKIAKPVRRFWPRFELNGWSPAMGFAAVLIVLQAVVIGGLLTRSEGTHQTLSGRGAGIEGTRLQLTFRPDAREADLRAALVSVQAEIVAGPGALGVYTIVVPPENAKSALAQLQRRSDLVQSVHLLDSGK